MVFHPKLTPDQVLNHRRIPASGSVSRILRIGFEPLGELLALGLGEFARSSWRGFVNQTGHTLEEELISVVPNGLLTESQQVSDFAHALTLRQSQEGMN